MAKSVIYTVSPEPQQAASAYAGLDPSVYQSGNFQAKKTRMSKRGSKVLRYALVNAAYKCLLKTMPPSRLTTKPRWRKAGLTIMPLGTVRQARQNHLENDD